VSAKRRNVLNTSLLTRITAHKLWSFNINITFIYSETMQMSRQPKTNLLQLFVVKLVLCN